MADHFEAMPLVDVILPTHRRPHTLAYSIESVLAQTHANLRLHVVGDGCDERTAAVVRGFADTRLDFRIFPKGRGFGYAHRNQVLRATEGELVAYASDDDLWFLDHLARGIEELATRHLDLVAFRSCHVAWPEELDPHFFAYDWQSGFAREFLRNWFMGAVNCVHRRSVFERVGMWNDKL